MIGGIEIGGDPAAHFSLVIAMAVTLPFLFAVALLYERLIVLAAQRAWRCLARSKHEREYAQWRKALDVQIAASIERASEQAWERIRLEEKLRQTRVQEQARERADWSPDQAETILCYDEIE